MTAAVAVIITARDAEATIGDAVASALEQPEVAEVVVIDDASSDATGDAAHDAARGDPRLLVLRQATNIGPAAARNLAIARSTAPYIAILDADDYLLPGRFARMLAVPDWDLIADNIAFVPEDAPERIDGGGFSGNQGGGEVLALAAFVRGNIAQANVRRGELGFLKPVIRRAILPTDGPIYDPGLWLGEDYDLYVRLLLSGARFRLDQRVGYVARVRSGSLSGRHRTRDLLALLQASARHMAAADGQSAAAIALRDHHRQLHHRYLLRAFLDRKAGQGVGAALAFAIQPPANFAPILRGVLADKLAGLRPSPPPVGLRTLLPLQGPLGSSAETAPDGKSPAAQAPASSSATTDR